MNDAPGTDEPDEQARPLLLSASEAERLASLLEHLAVLAPAETAAEAEGFAAALRETSRRGEASFEYLLAGPWGNHWSATESSAIAECIEERAKHWAEGHGRDDRYHAIRAERLPTVDFDDGSRWIGPTETIDVPDSTLTAEEAAENSDRLAAADASRAALYAHLSGLTERDEPDPATAVTDETTAAGRTPGSP